MTGAGGVQLESDRPTVKSPMSQDREPTNAHRRTGIQAINRGKPRKNCGKDHLFSTKHIIDQPRLSCKVSFDSRKTETTEHVNITQLLQV